MCGRSTNAASPIKQLRPKPIRETTRSTIAWMNGSAVRRTTSANGVGSSASAAECSCSVCQFWTDPGGTVSSAVTPLRSVNRSVSRSPGAMFWYQTQLHTTEPSGPGIG
jgi:hypothetical protein